MKLDAKTILLDARASVETDRATVVLNAAYHYLDGSAGPSHESTMPALWLGDCQHDILEDCMNCARCGRCDETLDDDDICDSCRADGSICLAGSPAVNGVCGDAGCVCAPPMTDAERAEYLAKVGACEQCGSTPCSCLEDLFGPVIHSYTRAEAIADGTLIDLGAFSFRENLTILQESGIKFPTAITRAAYNRAVQEDGRDLPPCQDLSGRMWDLCYMLRLAARGGGSEIRFKLCVWNWVGSTDRTRHETITLKAVCGPGDTAEPVITIMLPEED
jgi:hypothetical protein